MLRYGEGSSFSADKGIFILFIGRNFPFKLRFQLSVAWVIGDKAMQKPLRAKDESGRLLPKVETVFFYLIISL